MKQAICISGESGAGKSYGTRKCMEFITGLFNELDGPGEEGEIPMEDKIMNCNVILEAFGNAKTVMNNDSSRFGKYFILMVDKADKHIKGAQIKSYLLEKSRVNTQAVGERNYHVFYAVVQYMEEELLQKYLFCGEGESVDMEEFNYFKKSKCFEVPEINDKRIFEKVSSFFFKLGFSPEEQDSVYRTLSAVLNIGNLEIDDSDYEQGGSGFCKFVQNKYYDRVLSLLGVDEKGFNEGCCAKSRTFMEGTTLTPRSKPGCENIRDALAKDLFNNCFTWIVKKLNVSLAPTKKARFTTIGLLDIFGFEDFKVNSIE